MKKLLIIAIIGLAAIAALNAQQPPPPPAQAPQAAQPAPPPREARPSVMPRTPLPQDVLDLLANEISGQIIFNNEVKLAGAPWLREAREFKEGFYESETIAALARSYGVADVRIDRFPRDAQLDYAVAGELWTLKPEKKLVARLEADPALIAGAPPELDLTGDLVYIPPLDAEEAKKWQAAGPQEPYAGKVALMWGHAGQEAAKALDAAGVAGIISFASRERYFDPNQVVYSRGSYTGLKNLRFGLTVSWRQWSELLEDVEAGRAVTVRAAARIEKHSDRFENVLCAIPDRARRKASSSRPTSSRATPSAAPTTT
jgi:hypothetical protein